MSHNPLHSNWTDERVEILKRGTEDGLTCSQIGRELGVTRNAVIGKQHRLGIKSKHRSGGSVMGTRPRKTPTREIKSKFVRSAGGRGFRLIETVTGEQPELPAEAFANPKPLLELERENCRWPGTGEGMDMLFCAAPAFEDYPYCYHHCCIAYQVTRRPITRGEFEQTQRHMRKMRKAKAA